jgi:hypothetical protein
LREERLFWVLKMRDEAITDAPRPAGTVMTVGEEIVDAGDARKK